MDCSKPIIGFVVASFELRAGPEKKVRNKTGVGKTVELLLDSSILDARCPCLRLLYYSVLDISRVGSAKLVNEIMNNTQ